MRKPRRMQRVQKQRRRRPRCARTTRPAAPPFFSVRASWEGHRRFEDQCTRFQNGRAPPSVGHCRQLQHL
eukprot:9370513-Lingulodinium_polyedra.AAC.1